MEKLLSLDHARMQLCYETISSPLPCKSFHLLFVEILLFVKKWENKWNFVLVRSTHVTCSVIMDQNGYYLSCQLYFSHLLKSNERFNFKLRLPSLSVYSVDSLFIISILSGFCFEQIALPCNFLWLPVLRITLTLVCSRMQSFFHWLNDLLLINLI